MHERTLFIFNPAARSERAAQQRARLAAYSPRADVRLTDGPGDAERLAREAALAGYGTVVAAGGDGTVNEVVNGLLAATAAGGSCGTTLGVLPIGTMNVFAAELGIPGNQLRRGLEILERGHTRTIDLARANDRFFVQMAGVGFDAQAVSEVDREMKKNLGALSYVIAAARVAARPLPRLVIEAEDGTVREGGFVLVGNGRFYGGPFAVFKEASLEDGKLDVIVCRTVTHLDLLVRYLPGVLMGTHLSLPEIDFFQSSRLRVRPANGETEPVPFEADGELAGHAPVDLSLLPRALRVLAPAPKRPGSRVVAPVPLRTATPAAKNGHDADEPRNVQRTLAFGVSALS